MTLVGALATVHAPFIAGSPDLAPDEQRARVDSGFASLRTIVDRLEPDVIVTVSSEHITNFLSDDVPAFAVSTGDDNPTQPEFGLPDRRVANRSAVAEGLVDFARQDGIDIETYPELHLDHGTNLPLKFIRPEYDIPVVPIIVNTVWQPFPTVAAAHRLGTTIARFAEHEGTASQMVVIGTGGLSHWVGNRRHGDMNGDFDTWFVDRIMSGDHERLSSLSDDEIDEAGDGAHEVRTWITAAAAASTAGLVPELVLAEPFVPGWNVGVYQVAWQRPPDAGKGEQ